MASKKSPNIHGKFVAVVWRPIAPGPIRVLYEGESDAIAACKLIPGTHFARGTTEREACRRAGNRLLAWESYLRHNGREHAA